MSKKNTNKNTEEGLRKRKETFDKFVNQDEIISRIADKTGLKKMDIKEMLRAFKEVVVDVLREDKILFLKNVLTIRPTIVKGRNRYMPESRKIVYIQEHKGVKIVPSEKLAARAYGDDGLKRLLQPEEARELEKISELIKASGRTPEEWKRMLKRNGTE